MDGNYGQEDVRIQYPRIKGRIVLGKVYRAVNAQEESVQVYNFILNNEPFLKIRTRRQPQSSLGFPIYKIWF
jgi:hypothetical protein